jgi:hypothetical protein
MEPIDAERDLILGAPDMNQGHSIARNDLKRKIAVSFLTGIVTTGMVSFSVVLINLGLTEKFWQVWVRSWMLGQLVAFPAILVVSPLIKRFVDLLFGESTCSSKV